MIKGIIFDFDGVIVESIQVKTDAFANMYNKYGKSVINKVVNHHESNGGMSRYEKIKYYHNNFLNKEITSKETLASAHKRSNSCRLERSLIVAITVYSLAN